MKMKRNKTPGEGIARRDDASSYDAVLGDVVDLSAISSPQQDDVIERILRHLNRWDPPWLPQRKARGPPPSTRPPQPGALQPESPGPIDPVIDDELYVDELYVVDPPFDHHGPPT